MIYLCLQYDSTVIMILYFCVNPEIRASLVYGLSTHKLRSWLENVFKKHDLTNAAMQSNLFSIDVDDFLIVVLTNSMNRNVNDVIVKNWNIWEKKWKDNIPFASYLSLTESYFFVKDIVDISQKLFSKFNYSTWSRILESHHVVMRQATTTTTTTSFKFNHETNEKSIK